MASPEAASVVERLRLTLRLGEKYPEEVTASLLTRRDAEALLALVEAAKYVSSETWFRVRSEGSAKILSEALDALHGPASKDAEGAKP